MSRSFTFSGKRNGSGELIGEWVSGDGPMVVLPRGSIVEGRYEVIEYLGSGASASVYKCVDTLLGNLEVALKVLPSSVVDNQIAIKRLQRELLTNFDFDHPNIARFYECVRGDHFIGFVMEYVSGGSLADVFESGKRFTADETRIILTQIARALEVIHGAGVVHRDLKLENILFSENGTVKVTDFGLAREASAFEESLAEEEGKPSIGILSSAAYRRSETLTNGVAGSPLYLAPEYISAGTISVQSDIYAVGVIGYQLLTGVEPYQFDDILDMFKAKLREPPKPALEVCPTCSPALAAIVERAMAVNPEDRFQDAWHLRAALENLQSSSGAILMTEAYKGQIQSYVTRPPALETVTLDGQTYAVGVQGIVDFFGLFGPIGYFSLGILTSALLFSGEILYMALNGSSGLLQLLAKLTPPWLSQVARFLGG